MGSERTKTLLQWDGGHIVHSRYGIGGNIGIVVDRGQGIYFEDTEGKGKELVENKHVKKAYLGL